MDGHSIVVAGVTSIGVRRTRPAREGSPQPHDFSFRTSATPNKGQRSRLQNASICSVAIRGLVRSKQMPVRRSQTPMTYEVTGRWWRLHRFEATVGGFGPTPHGRAAVIWDRL